MIHQMRRSVVVVTLGMFPSDEFASVTLLHELHPTSDSVSSVHMMCPGVALTWAEAAGNTWRAKQRERERKRDRERESNSEIFC